MMSGFVIFLTVFLLHESFQDVYGVNITDISVAVNDSVILPCIVDDVTLSIWLVDKKNAPHPQTLTSGNTAFYEHLHALSVTTKGVSFNYNLLIFAAKEDSEGTYFCKEQGIQKSEVLLSVEVPPTVWLEINNSKLGDTLDVIVNEKYQIQCWAEGGRPSFNLSWEIDNTTTTEGTLQVKGDGNKISTVINYRPQLHETRLSCRTDGQKIVSSIHSDVFLNVLYKPMCNIVVQQTNQLPNTYLIHCVCVANPDVSGVFLSTNNSMYVEKSTTVLKTNYSTKIFCKGRNIVGFSETATKRISPPRILEASIKPSQEAPQLGFFTGITTTLIVIVLILVSLLIAVIAISRSRLKSEMHIISTYSVCDLQQKNDSVDKRPRLPSPSLHRSQRCSFMVQDQAVADDAKIYDYATQEQLVQTTDTIPRTQNAHNIDTYYVSPDVQTPYKTLTNSAEDNRKRNNSHQYALMNPGTTSDSASLYDVTIRSDCGSLYDVTIQSDRGSLYDVTIQSDYGSSRDITIPTINSISELNPDFLSAERERAMQRYLAMKKLTKLKSATLAKQCHGFSNTAISSSGFNTDVQSMSSCRSSFSDLSNFAFDENSVPCEAYERYSMIFKQQGKYDPGKAEYLAQPEF